MSVNGGDFHRNTALPAAPRPVYPPFSAEWSAVEALEAAVAIYRYRCAGCGPFDVSRPIGTAGPAEPCASCGGEAPRVFTPPLVTRTSRPLARAYDAQEASAHEPRVVSRPPAAPPRAPAPPADPRHAQLPRP
jgi:putative FmdB family regulatory protein